MDNNTISVVERFWHLVEKGGLSFFLFLITLGSAYIFYKIVLGTAKDLRGQNEDIKKLVDGCLNELNPKLDDINKRFDSLDTACVSCHKELIEKIALQHSLVKEHEDFIKDIFVKELNKLSQNQGAYMAMQANVSSHIEQILRSVQK